MNSEPAGKVRIGVSGWQYPPWRGVFYPRKLPRKKELHYCGQVFASVEINGSFYSLQRPTSYQRWRDETPDDFVFAVKGSRYITHMLKLRNAEVALANFFASGLLALGPKLGPILWQFPPNFTFRPEVLESFFKQLPRTMQQAADVATGHDRRLAGGRFLLRKKTDRSGMRWRYAIRALSQRSSSSCCVSMESRWCARTQSSGHC